MKPSLFAIYPWGSVLGRREYEVVAKNIMSILFRTGDTFRELTWEEYKTERLKDEGFSENEKEYFEKAISYCVNEERAMCFCPDWRDVYVEALKGKAKQSLPDKFYSEEEIIQLFKDYSDYRNSDEMHELPAGKEPMEFEEWISVRDSRVNPAGS